MATLARDPALSGRTRRLRNSLPQTEVPRDAAVCIKACGSASASASALASASASRTSLPCVSSSTWAG